MRNLKILIFVLVIVGGLFLFYQGRDSKDHITNSNENINSGSGIATSNNDKFVFDEDYNKLEKIIASANLNKYDDTSVIEYMENKEELIMVKANYDENNRYLSSLSIWYKDQQVYLDFSNNMLTEEGQKEWDNFSYKQEVLQNSAATSFINYFV